MTKYIGLVLVGSRGTELLHGGREYVSRRAVRIAAARAGRTLIETRRAGERLPAANDAQGWDAYRLSHGVAAR